MQKLSRDYLIHTVCFLDPAGGKENKQKTKARSAIVAVSSDAANRIFVREAWAERCATQKIYQKIYEFNARYKPEVFGIEGNAQQGLFADSVSLDAYEKGINLPSQSIVHPTSMNKDFRIRTHLQPVVSQGRLFVKKSQYALLEEVLDFPMSSIKDIIDALASAVSILPKQTFVSKASDETQAYLDYLRNSGAPMEYIEQQSMIRSRDDLQINTMDDYLQLVRGGN